MKKFEDRKVLITGAAGGIGLETAMQFKAQGAHVAACDISLPDKPGNLDFRKLDVTSQKDWEQAFEDFKPDILINNAGIPAGDLNTGQDPENCTLESWRKVMAVNLDGVFLGSQYAVKSMKKTGGVIINIASIAGQMGIPSASAYGASKAAVINFTKSLAMYCGMMNYPVRCNSVLPGPIRTPIWSKFMNQFPSQDEGEKIISSGVPLQRVGLTEEVASMVLYLASDDASYCNGAEFVVDGGNMAGIFRKLPGES